jgi:hypothetical protein
LAQYTLERDLPQDYIQKENALVRQLRQETSERLGARTVLLWRRIFDGTFEINGGKFSEYGDMVVSALDSNYSSLTPYAVDAAIVKIPRFIAKGDLSAAENMARMALWTRNKNTQDQKDGLLRGVSELAAAYFDAKKYTEAVKVASLAFVHADPESDVYKKMIGVAEVAMRHHVVDTRYDPETRLKQLNELPIGPALLSLGTALAENLGRSIEGVGAVRMTPEAFLKKKAA